jgi:hypothetical protein
MKPNIARIFNALNDVPETYVMGLGVLSPAGHIPKVRRGEPSQIRANFTGVFFGNRGKTEEQTVPVTVESICAASWCGGYPKTYKEMLVFLKKSPSGYLLRSAPCGGHFKVEPTKKEINLLRKCMRRGGCTEAQIKLLGQW